MGFKEGGGKRWRHKNSGVLRDPISWLCEVIFTGETRPHRPKGGQLTSSLGLKVLVDLSVSDGSSHLRDISGLLWSLLPTPVYDSLRGESSKNTCII